MAEAIEIFDALVKAYPQDAEARLARGRADEAAAALLLVGGASPPRRAADLTSDGFATTATSARARVHPLPAGEEAYRRSAIESLPRGAPPRARARRGAASARARAVAGREARRGRARAERGGDGPSPAAASSRISCSRASRTSAGGSRRRSLTPRPRSRRGRCGSRSTGARRPAAARGPAGARPASPSPAVAVPDDRASEDGWLRYNLGAQRARARDAPGAARDGAADEPRPGPRRRRVRRRGGARPAAASLRDRGPAWSSWTWRSRATTGR